MRTSLRIFLIAFAFLSSTFAFAFPEMIRHGYVNCTSCHVSPNGGGVLNPYGRQSSVAVLSTWGGEDEAKPVYNLFTQPDWIDTGAFVRVVQTAFNNTQVSNGYFWWMEGDLEAAVHFGPDKKWTFDLALGISPDVLNGLLPKGASPLASRRQYLMYRLSDTNSVRAGKFLADYGIFVPDHTIATRQGVGFDEGSETYNIEYGYQGEKWSGSVSADLGRPDDSSLLMEKGAILTGALNLSDHDKVGWSSYFGTQNGSSRELTGPFALLGFSPRFYALGEVDFQFTQPGAAGSTQGLFTYERVGYEVVQGLHLYLMEQTFIHSFGGTFQTLPQQIKYGPTTNRLTGIGPGVYWYPRPHFYFQLEVQQQFSGELPSSQTSGFLTGNLYL
jgi:hypothetical protein